MVIDVNLKGAALLLQACHPAHDRLGRRLDHQHRLVRGAAGLHGAAGCLHDEQGRLIALTKSLAVQYAKQGIRANAICPGPIETPLLRQLWTSEEARNLRLGRIPWAVSAPPRTSSIWASIWPAMNRRGRRAP